jgi:hypothetical protein
MKIKMKLGRDTKGTFVYKNEDEDAAIPSLYIKKSAIKKGDAPKEITVEIPEIK